MEEAGVVEAGNPQFSYTILYYYDSGAKTYRTFYCDSTGGSALSTATFDGHTMKSNWEQTVKGKTYKCRSVSIMAPDAKRFDYERIPKTEQAGKQCSKVLVKRSPTPKNRNRPES